MTIEYTTAAKLQAEIERLRVEVKVLRAAVQSTRADAIEECARIVEKRAWAGEPFDKEIAAAIRALKSNTGG